MRTSDRSVSRPCSARVSQTLEPPWYGPVCPVVGEGRRREAPPYPDQCPKTGLTLFDRLHSGKFDREVILYAFDLNSN